MRKSRKSNAFTGRKGKPQYANFTFARKAKGQAELLAKGKELSTWFNTVLDDGITTSDAMMFAQSLNTGVRLCKMFQVCVPEQKIRFKASAQPSSFHARENIQKFVAALHKSGLSSAATFTPDDVLQLRNLKTVMDGLLFLANLGVNNNIAPPPIVAMEIEIRAARDEPMADPVSETKIMSSILAEENPTETKQTTATNAVVEEQEGADSKTEEQGETAPADDDEPDETLVNSTCVLDAQSFGLTTERLTELRHIFDSMDESDDGFVTRREFVTALVYNEEVNKFMTEVGLLARDFKQLTEAADGTVSEISFKDFVTWIAAARDHTTFEAEAASIDAKLRVEEKKRSHSFLPYIARCGDLIDEALAAAVNDLHLDVKIQRIRITNRKKARAARRKCKGLYVFGVTKRKGVFVRLIQDDMFVYVENHWVELPEYIEDVIRADLRS